MSRLALCLAPLALAAGAAPSSAAPSGRDVLAAATAAARALESISYEGEEESRTGAIQRVITGRVQLVRFSFSDPIGGKLSVRGEVVRLDASDPEAVALAYDGETVRALVPAAELVIEGFPGYGGQALLDGSGASLVVNDLLAAEPYAAELEAPAVTYVGREEVEVETCDVVAVEYGDPYPTAVWYFGVDDHLPRQRERRFVSARGEEVTSVLTMRELKTDVAVDGSAFAIEAPEGFTTKLLAKKPPEPFNIGNQAPNWTLKDGDGREHSLSEYRGQLVVLDFWATWCPHCRRAMPSVQQMHDQYSDRGVAVLAINCRDKANADPVGFVRGRGFTYPVLLDGNKIAPKYQVRGIPSFYVIAPDGRLLFKQSGFSAQVEQTIRRLIRQHVGEDSRGEPLPITR
ncbi:MAG: TlpA family protein disulfide reductase [Planctomycetota bacterium]|jgi:thiol-disulfide isomerase/thioredoxin